MRRFILSAWIFGGAIVLLAPGASAQIESPTYANLYWESSNPPPGFSGSWDDDITLYSFQQQQAGNVTASGMALMTRDLIDSYLKSFLSSGWVAQLQPYGVFEADFNLSSDSPTSPPLFSFQIVPDQDPNCKGVPPPIGDFSLSDWNENLPGFMACAIAEHPAELTGTPVNGTDSAGAPISVSNVVFNVFYPPWLTGTSNDANYANLPGPALCGFPGASADNFEIVLGAFTSSTATYGQEFTVEPTQPGCDSSGLSGIVNVLSHEVAEGTAENQIADDCQTGVTNQTDFAQPPLPFLAFGLQTYLEKQPVPICYPQLADIPSMASPESPLACGSGQFMTVQVQLDESIPGQLQGFYPVSAPRNSPPWDVLFPGPGYEGSLYAGLDVPGNGPNNPPFTAGFEHFSGLPNAVTIGVQWFQDGVVQMHGFGTNYVSGSVPPLTAIGVKIFDTTWGQENFADTPAGLADPIALAEGGGAVFRGLRQRLRIQHVADRGHASG